MKTAALLSAVVTTALAVACGGSHSDDSPAPAQFGSLCQGTQDAHYESPGRPSVNCYTDMAGFGPMVDRLDSIVPVLKESRGKIEPGGQLRAIAVENQHLVELPDIVGSWHGDADNVTLCFGADCADYRRQLDPPTASPPPSSSSGGAKPECFSNSDCGGCAACYNGRCEQCPRGSLGVCTC
jgi:hypothetical protein